MLTGNLIKLLLNSALFSPMVTVLGAEL